MHHEPRSRGSLHLGSRDAGSAWAPPFATLVIVACNRWRRKGLTVNEAAGHRRQRMAAASCAHGPALAADGDRAHGRQARGSRRARTGALAQAFPAIVTAPAWRPSRASGDDIASRALQTSTAPIGPPRGRTTCRCRACRRGACAAVAPYQGAGDCKRTCINVRRGPDAGRCRARSRARPSTRGTAVRPAPGSCVAATARRT